MGLQDREWYRRAIKEKEDATRYELEKPSRGSKNVATAAKPPDLDVGYVLFVLVFLAIGGAMVYGAMKWLLRF
jgi:hypothetical protein